MTHETGSILSNKQRDSLKDYTRWKAFLGRRVRQGSNQQGKNKSSLEQRAQVTMAFQRLSCCNSIGWPWCGQEENLSPSWGSKVVVLSMWECLVFIFLFVFVIDLFLLGITDFKWSVRAPSTSPPVISF